MRTIAIIPARSGSKGLHHKNIRPLCGKPLLAYSVEVAIASGLFDTVHVSTDDEQYAEIARSYGADVPFLRCKTTASDTASSVDVMLEVLQRYEELGHKFDTCMLLQPTSPLRKVEDLKAAFTRMEETNATSVVSVCEVDHSPLWCNTLPENGCMDGFLVPAAKEPRQKLAQYYRLNGAIYLTTVANLRETGTLNYDQSCFATIMPRSRSIDIDEELDFAIAEAIVNCGL